MMKSARNHSDFSFAFSLTAILPLLRRELFGFANRDRLSASIFPQQKKVINLNSMLASFSNSARNNRLRPFEKTKFQLGKGQKFTIALKGNPFRSARFFIL